LTDLAIKNGLVSSKSEFVRQVVLIHLQSLAADGKLGVSLGEVGRLAGGDYGLLGIVHERVLNFEWRISRLEQTLNSLLVNTEG